MGYIYSHCRNQACPPSVGEKGASEWRWRTTCEASPSGGKIFYFFARNPLKSPDSAKLNQIKPSKSKHFCLV
jgi:hypothetical protein